MEKEIVTALVSLSSGAVGGLIGMLSAWTTTSRQNKLAVKRETIEKKFQCYNKLIEADNRLEVLNYPKDGNSAPVLLNLKVYMTEIRPIILSGYHLYPLYIRVAIREIEDQIRQMNILKVIDDETLANCASSYNKLLLIIENEYLSV